jgi:transcriptional regulator with XRE-family HTH domain
MRNNDLIWTADSFGEVIRRGREAAGLNQKQLARACGTISPMYVCQIEKGDRVPSVRVCRLLAKALELNEQKLLLLAHQTRAPTEIKDLLVHGTHIDNRFMNLSKEASKLPKEKKNRLAKAWEEVLRAVL